MAWEEACEAWKRGRLDECHENVGEQIQFCSCVCVGGGSVGGSRYSVMLCWFRLRAQVSERSLMKCPFPGIS